LNFELFLLIGSGLGSSERFWLIQVRSWILILGIWDLEFGTWDLWNFHSCCNLYLRFPS